MLREIERLAAAVSIKKKGTHQVKCLDLLHEKVQVLDPLTWILAHFLCTLR